MFFEVKQGSRLAALLSRKEFNRKGELKGTVNNVTDDRIVPSITAEDGKSRREIPWE